MSSRSQEVLTHFLFYRYYGLQLWFPEYFKHVIDENKPKNSTNKDDYDNCTNTDTKPYKDSLYEATASIPGNFLGVLVINIIGGKLLLSKMMSLSAFVMSIDVLQYMKYIFKPLQTNSKNWLHCKA